MDGSAMLRATCKIVLGGKDLTERIRPRLSNLTITTSREGKADELVMSIDATDGKVALPRKGVELSVMLGYEGRGVQLQGTYIVDEVEHTGTPDTITVTCRSAKLASGLNTRRERSWSDTTVGHVVKVIAGEHGLTARVSPKLAGIVVTQIDQTESDIALLRRIGSLWDAVATVKAGNLIFAPIGQGTTVSGKALPTVTIVRASGDRHRYHAADRNAYTGVRAKWHDVGAAGEKSALAGTADHVKVLRGHYAGEEDAKRAVASEMARVKRGACTFELDLAEGRPDLSPELPAKLSGWLADIDSVEWIIIRATHMLSGSDGYTTRIELESRATAAVNYAKNESDHA